MNQAVHPWRKMPKRFCNFERLLDVMEEKGLDALVLNTRHNVYYMTGFWMPALQADEPYLAAFIMSRHNPEEPIVVVGDVIIPLFIEQETWVEDIRPYRLDTLIQHDISLDGQTGLDRFVPEGNRSSAWYQGAVKTYARDDSQNMESAIIGALKDLGVKQGAVGVDELRLERCIEAVGARTVDAFWHMMDVRNVKTDAEIELLREATGINQKAQEKMVREWQPGMTWRESYALYTAEARRLGGNLDTPPVAAVNTTCPGRCFMMAAGTEPDTVLQEGHNLMLDCHGMLNGYCWDGGKTWRVGEPSPSGNARKRLKAAEETLREVNAACKPGATEEKVQSAGRKVLRKHGIPEADESLIVFHGLGLSHVDMAKAGQQLVFQDNAVIPTHLYIPGSPEERVWIEDVVRVTPDGGEGFFTWDYVDWDNG